MWAAFHICRSHLYFFLCLFCSYLLTFSYRSFASFLLYLQDFLYIIETETCTKSAWFPKAQPVPAFSLSKVYELFWVYSRGNDAFPFFCLKLGSMRYALPSPVIHDLDSSWIHFTANMCWLVLYMGFPGSSAGKESACNVGDLGSIPGLGRSPGEGKGYRKATDSSILAGDSMGYSPFPGIVHGVIKSWTRLSDFHWLTGLSLCVRDPLPAICRKLSVLQPTVHKRVVPLRSLALSLHIHWHFSLVCELSSLRHEFLSLHFAVSWVALLTPSFSLPLLQGQPFTSVFEPPGGYSFVIISLLCCCLSSVLASLTSSLSANL